MKYYSKAVEWIRQDLNKTKKSLFKILDYVFMLPDMDELDEQVKKEVAEISPIARYNYNSFNKKA